MSNIYSASCNACGYRTELTWPLWAVYQWPSGATQELAQEWIWCQKCGLQLAEHIHKPEYLFNLRELARHAHLRGQWDAYEIAEARKYTRYPLICNLHGNGAARWNAGDSIAFLNSIELHYFWRMTRGASAKCLKCGGHDFLCLPVDDNSIPAAFEHPHCGGTISMSRLRKSRAKRVRWTPEGEWIGPG